MIQTWLAPWLSADLSLISGFLTWIVVLFWLWRSGWKIQRRYFIEATQKPLTRNAIVWSAGIVGAIFFVAAQMRPGMPGVMTVAMIGTLSAYVDARTHRLPNAYTVAMAIGVVLGVIMGGGDVKLAPVLGALVGSVGLHAAVFSLALSFVSAGVAALWKIVVGSAGTKTRVPMGPWMIGSALVGTIAWGVVPDWL